MTLTIGLGCRRGISEAHVAAAVRAAAVCLLGAHPGWATHQVVQLATIDAKRDERGLLAYCKRRSLPIGFAPAEALAALSQHIGSPQSEAVLARFGIPGVCEAAALWAAANAVTLAQNGVRDAQCGGTGNAEAGVDASPLAGCPPELVLHKRLFDGVTIAIAAAATPPSHFMISLYELAHDHENRS